MNIVYILSCDYGMHDGGEVTHGVFSSVDKAKEHAASPHRPNPHRIFQDTWVQHSHQNEEDELWSAGQYPEYFITAWAIDNAVM